MTVEIRVARDQEPLESLPAVPVARHQVSGQRRPTPQPFTLNRSGHGNCQHLGQSGETWPEACTVTYQVRMRSAAHEHIEQEEVMFDLTKGSCLHAVYESFQQTRLE
jgi:hypothetical protein